MFGRGSVFNIVIADFEATKGGEVGAGPERFANILGEGADVGAARDMTTDAENGVGIFDNLGIIYGDFASGWCEVGAFSC